MDKQHILRILENTVMELNQLYRYTYDEDDLEKLNKYITIEAIDQTKDYIDNNLFMLIIETVLDGATPCNESVYRIITTFADVLNLKALFTEDEWIKFNTIIGNN